MLRLRSRHPLAARPFVVKPSPAVPMLGVAMCLLLMSSLGTVVWLRFGVWLAVGSLVFKVLGRRRVVASTRVS
jgi:APA family basic amino acid/polyamine antiporter